MLTVVIAIVFIVALGVALLSASYMGYAVTIAQKNDKSNFDSAETAMGQLRAGLHDAVSDALGNAYTETLKNSAFDPASDSAKTYFSNQFKADLYTEKLKTGDSSASPIFKATGAAGSYTYDTAAFQSYLDQYAPVGTTLTLSSTSSAAVEQSDSAVVLRGISLDYQRKGYRSVITTDIAIEVPAYNASAALPYEASKYSIIANKSLESSTAVSVDGSVYAGKIDNTAGLLTFDKNSTNSTIFCPGDVTVGKTANFTFYGSELWANNLNLAGSSSTFTETNSAAKTYVANDLTLGGFQSWATLTGSYIGFGSNTANTAEGDDNSANRNSSSSIVVNGKSSSLDLKGLVSLTLAGVSYIVPSTANDGSKTEIPMGQSVSIKSDQLAYLVPAAVLGSDYPTNPYIYSSGTPSLNVNYTAPLWSNSKKTLQDYLGSYKYQTPNDGTKPVRAYNFANGMVAVRSKALGGGSTIDYVFVIFTNQTAANRYFKDYCNSDPTKITQYFENYLSSYQAPVNAVNAKTAGNSYSGNYITSPSPSNSVGISDSTSVFAGSIKTTFDSRAANSPYAALVKESAIKKKGKTMEFYPSGTEKGDMTPAKVVAIVSSDDIDTINFNSLKLIISTGNVKVSTGFKGIVIAGGTITVGANITAAGSLDALRGAVNEDGELLSDYVSGTGSVGAKSDANKWDVEDLITYQNWSKS